MIRSLVAFALAVHIAACTAATQVQSHVDGIYVLQTVNSAELPFNEGRDQMGGLVSLVSDTLWLRVDGTFTDAAHVANTYDVGTAMTVNVQSGTWTEANGSIRFVDARNTANMYVGALAGETLTEATPGFTQVFVRH